VIAPDRHHLKERHTMKTLRTLAAGVIAAALITAGSFGIAAAARKNPVTFTAYNPGLGFKASCVSVGATQEIQISGFAVNTTPFDYSTSTTKIVIDGTTVINDSEVSPGNNSYQYDSWSPASLGDRTSWTTASITVTNVPVFGDYQQTFKSISC
jgi:ABC-type glycerol-3-phosphate transport system substrate-binding protein